MKQGKVIIRNDQVSIESLSINNEDLAKHLNEYENPANELFQLILEGLRIANYVKTNASVAQIEDVGDRIQDGIEKVGIKARKDIEDLLITHTDPNNSRSLAKAIVDIASAQFIKEFDPNNIDSPVNQLFERLDKISRTIEYQAGVKDASDKSPKKGGNFNQVMSPIIQTIAASHSDFSEFVDAVETETGAKVGDEVVTLNPDQTKSTDLKFVCEFKTAERTSQASALRELSEAMKNRDASAGIFVVNKTSKTEKWPEYSFYSGNRMIIVVDKDNPDINLIKFAYTHTRWTLTREHIADSKLIDEARMKFLIDKAMDDLKFISQIKGSLTGIKSSHTEAVSRVDELESRLGSTLKEASVLMAQTQDHISETCEKVA
jgi:hypothetical protein